MRELDRNPHDFDGEDDGVGVSEGSEDSKESEGTEDGEAKHYALKNESEREEGRSQRRVRDEKPERGRVKVRTVSS